MGSFIVPPVTVPILGFEVPSKFSNSTAPGTEDVVAPGVTEIVIAYDGVLVKVNASNDRPSAALSFDHGSYPFRQTAAAATLTPRRCGCGGNPSQFVRHDPSLPLVIRADERRRVKAVRQS
jgi:hypothetical protein